MGFFLLFSPISVGRKGWRKRSNYQSFSRTLTWSGATLVWPGSMLSTSCSPIQNSDLSPSQDPSPGFCIFCFSSHTCPHPARHTYTQGLILHGLYGLNIMKLVAFTCDLCVWLPSTSKGKYPSCSLLPLSPDKQPVCPYPSLHLMRLLVSPWPLYGLTQPVTSWHIR